MRPLYVALAPLFLAWRLVRILGWFLRIFGMLGGLLFLVIVAGLLYVAWQGGVFG